MSQTSSLSPSLALDTLPPGRPRLTLAPAALAWAAEFLVQPNGLRAKQSWLPTKRQARFLLWWYAVDPDGRWLYNHGVRRLAKGSGKSPFAAVMSLIEFAGPCRVKDIDGDRVIAEPVHLPLVEVAATAESQTANTMRMVRAMAPKGSRVVTEHSLDPGKTIYYKLDTGGELHVITSSATAAEGSESSFVVGDEVEHWLPNNGGTDLADVLDRNLAKSGSRMLSTANAWEPGIGSVAESEWDAWVAQQEGRTRGEGRILYDALIAPPDTDLTDEASLMAALEWVYGDCSWVDQTVIRDRIWDPRTKPDVSRRFYLNQPTAAVDAWTTPQLWGACADPSVTVADGEEIVMFFDGSKSSDATALIGCRMSDGHVFTIGVWEPGQDEIVSATEVDAAVSWAMARWTVVGFFADVREWESFAKVSWPAEYGDRMTVWAESGSSRDPQPIAWDMRGHVMEFTKAAELTEAEIADQQFTHDGDSRVARHVSNARRRPNRHGVSIGKESRGSPHKIDAAVCVIGVRMVRRLVLAEQARAKPEPKRRQPGRVYSF